MKLFPGALAMILCLSSLSYHAGAAVVRTRDGRTIEGPLRLDSGQLIVKPSGGTEVRLDLSCVLVASFKDAAPSAQTSSRDQRPEKLKPKPVEGLRAEYYADPDLKNVKLVRIDPKIEFSWWSGNLPDPSLPKHFSARWTGQIEPAYSETYTFRANVNDAARLWIDNRLIIDRWSGPPGNYGGTIDLKAARKYDLKLEYRSHNDGGHANLTWQSRRQGQEIIQPNRLYPPPGVSPPSVAIVSPPDGAVLVAPSIIIDVAASAGDGPVRKVEFYVDGNLLGSVDRAPWRLAWNNPVPGYHRLRARATANSGITARSEPSCVMVAGNGNGSLPPGWVEMPIGKLGPVGSATHAHGAFTLHAAEGDFFGEQEVFHYVCQPLNGDGSIVARIDSFTASQGPAAAGLLIRESLSSGRIRQAFCGIVPDTGIVFVRRENVWDEHKSTEDKGSPPCWLRLSRHGERIRAYQSSDGRKWRPLGERRIEMPPAVFIGLAIAASAPTAKALFDHVSIIAGSPSMVCTVKGVMLRNGSVIAADVRSVDDTSVKLSRSGRELAIPSSQVARILFRPLSSEVAERLQSGRSGLILSNGDFLDGVVVVKDGHVRVSSVLFGMRRFYPSEDIVAAVLRDVEPAPCKYEVTAVDGSSFKAASLSIDSGKLKLTDASDLAFTLASGEIVQIIATP